MPKIMVVDDEADSLYTIKAIIEDFGSEYEVITANCGNKCIELLKDNQIPDLILLDVIMYGMNGWQVNKKIKETSEWRDIPVIFFSSEWDESSKITANIIGNGFIEKPFDIKDLKKRLEESLKKQ